IITSESIRVRFESMHRLPVMSLSHTAVLREKAPIRASQPFVLEFGLFGGGSDRFCIELSTLDIVSTYRWLIASNASIDTLVVDEAPAYIHNRRN
ncbi:MAG: hypothetical protein WCL29_05155, partial [Pseudomonadota bacterium]